jgi:hypothetical protein
MRVQIILATVNSLPASIGELEDRLERPGGALQS